MMNRKKLSPLFFSIALLLLFLLSTGATRAQKFQFSYGIKKDGLNFKPIKNLIIIPVYINDRGPYNFILDTGVDPLIITDSTIVDHAQLNQLRKVKINGTGEGEEITAYISNNIKAKIGAATMDHIPTVILKEDVFNLSTHLGMKIHGLVGYHFFNSFIVKVNYTQSKIFFHLPQRRKNIKWDKLDLEFHENKPYINAKLQASGVGEIMAKLIIDCGASHALSLESHNGSVFPLPELNFPANLGVGLSGKINGNIGRVTELKLGNYALKDVLTSFPDFDDVAAKTRQKQRTGNLGADVLKKFTVVFDYQDHAMYLKKNSYFKEVFEHDMSGIELYVDDEKYKRVFVSRVEPGSPADKSGILAKDEILSINFVDASDYSLDAITKLLKSENNKTVLIEIERAGKIHIKLLALKKRL